jgi:hypothetical protein
MLLPLLTNEVEQLVDALAAVPLQLPQQLHRRHALHAPAIYANAGKMQNQG